VRSRLLVPTPPPYDALVWAKLPLEQRAKAVCAAWAEQGYGSPPLVYLAYLVKIVFYVAGWVFFCGLSPELGAPTEIARYWLAPLAFQKAILWSMLFEGLGLGCGSGPLTGRYLPPVGGALYFLRPGTTKLPYFSPEEPTTGGLFGCRRTVLDVALYATWIGATVWALAAPSLASTMPRLWPIVALVALMGLADRTLFLAVRAEHYWTTLIVMVVTPDWLGGAKAVQLALWFFAGFSKLNHHFPSVVGVMTSNSPLVRFGWVRRLMYRRFPDDLRPSRVATWLGHAGTALEMAVPLALVLARPGWSMWVALALVLALHGFITSNVPMGVPLEWNVMVVYGAFALFWAHPEVVLPAAIFDGSAGPLWLWGFLAVVLVGVPLGGNLSPRSFSFLPSMRYYAGNWAYSVWLFRGESHQKLGRLTTSAGWVYDQLARFYDRKTAVGVVGKVMGFRMMHLHGRALAALVPKLLGDARLDEYEWVDGEIVAGLVLGWNFGDGHLHGPALLRAVQLQCGFAEGELRCVFVEAEPLAPGPGAGHLAYELHDAATGRREQGSVSVRDLRGQLPWGGVATDETGGRGGEMDKLICRMARPHERTTLGHPRYDAPPWLDALLPCWSRRFSPCCCSGSCVAPTKRRLEPTVRRGRRGSGVPREPRASVVRLAGRTAASPPASTPAIRSGTRRRKARSRPGRPALDASRAKIRSTNRRTLARKSVWVTMFWSTTRSASTSRTRACRTGTPASAAASWRSIASAPTVSPMAPRNTSSSCWACRASWSTPRA
jgi:hypothetical protein